MKIIFLEKRIRGGDNFQRSKTQDWKKQIFKKFAKVLDIRAERYVLLLIV